MNALDKLVGAVSPERALKRQIARKQLEVMNSGYSNYGANGTKGSTKGWMYAGGSSREDIEDNLPVLRQRSRDLYMGAPLATAAVKTYRTSVIGQGLSLKPKVDYRALGITEEQAAAVEAQISREWELWADSTDCDAARLSNFYELQQLAFMNWMLSGDVLALLPVHKRAGSVYDLRVNLVEADRCYTPPALENDTTDKIVDGVERNTRGEVVAYYIFNRHPLGRMGNKPDDYKRVKAYGTATGRRQVLHLMNRERIGQVRGVPLLAPVVEALKSVSRYTEAELTATVVAAYQTVFISHTDPAAGANPFGEIIGEDEQIDAANEKTIEMAPGAIIDLAEGESANLVSPGRPNTAFDGFVQSMARQIGAALEVPVSLLLKSFASNYSASRGELLEAWKAFDEFRDWMVSGFCEPVYDEWLAEAVAKGRISAPGFFADQAVRRAWSGCEWYGPSRGQIDPVKEVNAAILRIQNGLSTGAKEAMELTSTNIEDNIRQRQVELELMKAAGMILEEQGLADDEDNDAGENK